MRQLLLCLSMVFLISCGGQSANNNTHSKAKKNIYQDNYAKQTAQKCEKIFQRRSR